MNPAGESGTTVLDVLVTVALIATVTGLGAPLVVHSRDAQQGRQAAQFLASQMRAARQQAVLTGRHTAVVFERRDDAWTVTQCVDGDGDGVLRADLASGIDVCQQPAQPLTAWFPLATIDRQATVPDLSGRHDGPVVAFGAGAMASFSPLGTSSSGSLTVMTMGGRHFGVRVAGVTGRVRVLRFAPEAGQWVDLH